MHDGKRVGWAVRGEAWTTLENFFTDFWGGDVPPPACWKVLNRATAFVPVFAYVYILGEK